MTSMRASIRRSIPRGQAAVEALMAIIVLIAVIFGGIELSRGVALRQSLDTACGTSARILSLDPSQWAYANTVIQDEVDKNVMGASATPTIKIYDSSANLQSANWLNSSAYGTVFILEAQVPFRPDIPMMASSQITITVHHWGVVERYP